MAKERLSKLQRWILKTTLEHRLKPDELDKLLVCILRRQLIAFWFRHKSATKYYKERDKFNASLTRSLRNLEDKGLIKSYAVFWEENKNKIRLLDATGDDGGMGLYVQSIKLTDQGREIASKC